MRTNVKGAHRAGCCGRFIQPAIRPDASPTDNTFLLVLPTLIGAFLIAGYIRVLVPEGVVQKWVGEESGFKGILVGYLAGTLTFGGPFISFPIAASLYHAGGSVITVTTYITSSALWGGGIIFYEFSILGLVFTIRLVSILFPLLVGGATAFSLKS